MLLENKKAIVTGGSRGIGVGIATALAEAGADVAIFYRAREEEAKKVIDKISSLGRKGISRKIDITNYEELEKGVKFVHEYFGKIDILVNNAGRSPRPVKDGDRELKDWRNTLELDLNAVFYCTKAVLGYMRKQGFGSIINISSANARMLSPTSGPYSAAKSAVEAFTKISAKEEGSNGIRVNAVAPGVIDTEMSVKMLEAMTESERKEMIGSIALGRLGSPMDIGRAVAFLSSDNASYITGEVLNVNGGIQM
jgi:3-oxoacyl-[acyl-carrier protein] reductase